MTKNHLHRSANSVTMSQSIPVPSPAIAVFQTEEVVVDTLQLNVPTYMRLTHSTQPTIAKCLTGDRIDNGGYMDTSSTPMVVNGPMVSLLNVPHLLIPTQLVDFVAAIRYLPTFVHRIISMIIYTATIAVTGCVFILLLAKFALLTWKKAFLPEENDVNGNIETDHPKKRLIRGKRNTHPKMMSAESFCGFVRSAHFYRTGRRSRSPQAKAIKGVYNTGCYEQLSVDDLKLVGTFLGIPRLSKLQQKSNLINAIVVQYETSLQSLNISDIKEVLSVREVVNVVTNNKKVLIKLAIEVGF